MPKVTLFALLFLTAVLASAFVLEAQDKPSKSLNSFRMKDVGGVDRALSDPEFTGKPVAFVFMSDWSELSHQVARAAFANAASFDGAIVPVCAGDMQRVRATREKLDPEHKMIWIQADGTTGNTFAQAFDGTENLTYVPSLLIIDADRKVRSSHIGEMTADAVKTALAAR